MCARWRRAAACVALALLTGLARAMPNYAGCPLDCMATAAAGACTNGTCLCAPGHGGRGCSFDATAVLGSADFYNSEGTLENADATTPDTELEGLLSWLFAPECPVSAPQFVVHVGCNVGAAMAWGARLASRKSGVLLCADPFLPALPAAGAGTTFASHLRTLLRAATAAGLRAYVVPYPGLPHRAHAVLAHKGIAPDAVVLSPDLLDSTGSELEGALREWWALLPPRGLLVVPMGAVSLPRVARAALHVAVHSFSAAAGVHAQPLRSHWVLVKGGLGGGGAGGGSATDAAAAAAASAAAALSFRASAGANPAAVTDAATAAAAAAWAANLRANAAANAATVAGSGPLPVPQQQQQQQQQQQPQAVPVLDPAWPPGWRPCGMRYIQVSHSSRTVSAGFVASGPWGNLLAIYFQGLAVAQLLGYTYQYNGAFYAPGEWLTHLPMRVPPGLVAANVSEVVRACELCREPEYWEFTMNCPALWTQARAAIRNVTRRALEEWAAANNKKLPTFEPTDAVIQVRCQKDTVLSHDLYGPAAYSFYVRYAPPTTRRFIAVYARHNHGTPGGYPPCETLVDAMGKFITQHRPGVTFEVVGGEKWEDWARLVYAPVVFRDSMSSWGLWSTLATAGKGFAPPMFAPFKEACKKLDYVRPEVDADYQFVEANVMYPEVGKRLGLQLDVDQTPQLEKIVTWLQTN